MIVIEFEYCTMIDMKNGIVDILWISHKTWDNSWCDKEREHKSDLGSACLWSIWDNDDLGGKMLELKCVK